MAIRGNGGYLTFSREWPGPLALDPARLETTGGITRISVDELAFWSGEQVTLANPAGLPFDILGTGYANTPDGHAFWGGGGSQGPVTQHRTGDAGVFWNASDAAEFWESPASVGLTTSATFYIHRDQMDRASFYPTEIQAHNGGPDGRIQLLPSLSGALVMAIASSASGYTAALVAAAGMLPAAIPDGEVPLSSLVPLAPVIAAAGEDADQRGWLREADLGQWVFETDPRLLDPTAIGEEFGDSTKGLVRGSGSFQAVFSNRYLGPDVANGAAFLRLVLLTRTGSKSRARFLLASGATAGSCEGSDISTIAGDLYYETDMLLGRCTLDNPGDGIVTFSGQFVSVGQIRLVSGAVGDG